MPGEALRLSFGFNTQVYDAADIRRIAGHFIHLLEQVTGNPNIAVSEIKLATPQEESEILAKTSFQLVIKSNVNDAVNTSGK
ncbi:condensation domain-containing protein [Paenibacillus sp. BJ-4]|uniref:condensation domain-containing protein n=1 Tax=Paenibacillus sp. BJ-4 TaxID=2878097 RepID=UPI001CF089E1|nr:condensation domain-containing protein [Paenibacillus sp. BJ-4]